MNRILKRPMFRMGGAAEGITSGLDQPRKQYFQGTDPYDRALSTTERAMKDLERFRGEKQPMMPGGLPNFLTSFGLNLLSTPPQGGLLATAATAAKDPFATFQAAQLTEREDRAKRAEDIFSGALASEYDILAQKAKAAGGDPKTAEVERDIVIRAQEEIFKNRDILNNLDSTDEEKKIAERNIKIQQNVLQKELGVPAEYLAIISSPELFDSELNAYIQGENDKIKERQRKYLDANPDKTPEDALQQYPLIDVNSATARSMTIDYLKERYGYAEGGRAGYRMGSQPMMKSVVESERQTGEVQDLSYTELRSRLPQEISNEIVMLLANSKQALVDFANIATTEDIANFNQQYDVNLTLPQGA
tara:strand:+ start:82 stop:1167 length:1086 start_codon:yes stop_codon:yes gene_type:complete